MSNFPKIDYQYWFNNYSWEGFSSMRGMISTMINKQYIDSDVSENNITDIINQKIIEYNNNPNDNLLFEIFLTRSFYIFSYYTIEKINGLQSEAVGPPILSTEGFTVKGRVST